jgi:hypothetical protein
MNHKMSRNLKKEYLRDEETLKNAGIDLNIIELACNYTHSILDLLDEKLIESGASRISEMIEMANLSSMVGNLIGAGIAKFSNGLFERNDPHKYPDIIGKVDFAHDIEIKVALETNKPKGHLAKEGYYLICRYILANTDGRFDIKNRGNTVWIWEVRFGYLEEINFSVSSTIGDSGKTATINGDGMDALKVIYCDLSNCPHSKNGKIYKNYMSLFRDRS